MGEGEKDPIEPRFWQRLTFRVALVVVVCIVIGEIITFPIWELIIIYFHPEAQPSWKVGMSVGEVLSFLALIVVFALTIGGFLGWVASRYSMSRLRSIAAEAASARGSDLPGPFEESGYDEITQLARALNTMRTRVVELLEQLRERDERRNEWVAQVSHDLRTPLTALITSLDHTSVLLERGGEAGEQLRENNAAAHIDAQRLATLVEDLFEIARLEVDPSIETEAVLPGEVVERTVRGLDPLAREAGIRVVADIQPDLPFVEADGRLVVRALENLVLNSIQHARTSVEVSAARIDGTLQIAVEDDGDGFPEKGGVVSFTDLREHRSRADSAGLGLMVTQRVALVHGGSVEAQNRPEGGARVSFALPLNGNGAESTEPS